MKKTWILLLIFFSAGILSYADAQSVKNLNTKEFKVQIWDFEKNKDRKCISVIKPAIIDSMPPGVHLAKKLSPILEEIQKNTEINFRSIKWMWIRTGISSIIQCLQHPTDALYSRKRQTFYGNRVTSERTNNRHY